MEFMYDHSAAHKYFLYSTSTPTTTSSQSSHVPSPLPFPLNVYYPTSSTNGQELMMNLKATDDHIHPPPRNRPLAEAAAPFIPFNNQVQCSEGSNMLMDFSCIDFNEDICSNSSFYFETSREAKVLKYREKRKRRNFTKKIRYPSRKAHADRRPRMRGRFIKSLEEDEQPHINGTE